MAQERRMVGAAGVEVTPVAIRAAAEIAAAVRAATADLPFGSEPTSFLAALEELAPADPEGDEP